jgi:hypothetical protein
MRKGLDLIILPRGSKGIEEYVRFAIEVLGLDADQVRVQ